MEKTEREKQVKSFLKYEEIYRKFPLFADKINNLAFYAGFDRPEGFAGFVVLFSALLSIILAVEFYFLGFGIFSFIFLFAGPIFYGFIYIVLSLIADSRARFIEKMLPDNLQLIAANVRAGMTVDKAIWLSARPELGILED